MKKTSYKFRGALFVSAFLALAVLSGSAFAAYSSDDKASGLIFRSGGIATELGIKSVFDGVKALGQEVYQSNQRAEEAGAADTAKQSLVDENNDMRTNHEVAEGSKRVFETASLGAAEKNQGPKTNALGSAMTRIGKANLMMVGGTVAQKLVSSANNDYSQSDNASMGSGRAEHDWVALACKGKGMPQKWAQKISESGVDCQYDKRLAGAALSPSVFMGIDSIKGKPGTDDMNSFKALVTLGCRNTGNMPQGSQLTKPGGWQDFVSTAGASSACREYAACLATKLKKKFGYDQQAIGTDYSTQKAALDKEGRKCGADGYFSEECLRLSRFMGRKQNGQDMMKEPNQNAMGAFSQVSQLDSANTMESLAGDSDPSTCMTAEVKSNIQANLNYFKSKEFMLALQDGSFARDVNTRIAMLDKVDRLQAWNFMNAMRKFNYGVDIVQYAADDPAVQKKPEQMALADVFDEVGVDMASLMPVSATSGQKLGLYASLLPSLTNQMRDPADITQYAQNDAAGPKLLPAMQFVMSFNGASISQFASAQ